jgi:hypothetical protein
MDGSSGDSNEQQNADASANVTLSGLSLLRTRLPANSP